MADTANLKPVLICGAGINGCAVARELALNGIPVYLVDQADIATGATSKSSRLIHGGLRYLEYGDVGLVAESLRERERLLTLAPQFVHPLQLSIPVERLFGGLWQSAFRFFRLSRFSWGRWLTSHVPIQSPRGLIVVRFGLWLYDRIARSSRLPGHTVQRVDQSRAPAVDAARFRWLCKYYDAQIPYPERFVIALLEDAQVAAADRGTLLRILPYHRVSWEERAVCIRSVDDGTVADEFEPSVVINATGAWGDLTLHQFGISAERLLGGTKGSHFVTAHAGLRQALGEGGVYAEASDGRLVFILPFAGAVLVGTTDERFEGPPDQAVATSEELHYLIDMVQEVFPQCRLEIQNVALHYSGVRPLPYSPAGQTGSIPRGHWIHSSEKRGVPVETLIGGKLTTCRALAEEVADRVLGHLKVPRTAESRERPLPGAEDYPEHPHQWCQRVADETHFTPEQVAAVFALVGTRAKSVLTTDGQSNATESLAGTDLPLRFVDWSISHEWVHKLGDLVERRLGLVLTPGMSRETLEELARRLARAGLLAEDAVDREVEAYAAQLCNRYGVVLSTWATMTSV